MFFVAGITGKVGGAAARRLLEMGKQVRGLARDPQKAADWTGKGVEIRQGDLNDSSALADAMQGAEGAFVMMPPIMAPEPGFANARRIAESYREAIDKAKPARVVALSSVGSQQTSGLGLITATHILEQELSSLEIPRAFVRPGSFFENYLYALQAAKSGFFDTFFQPTGLKVPMVATADIGNEIARLLTGDWTGRKVVELGSLWTADDIAEALSEALGQPVEARSIPRAEWTATLRKFGFPAGAIAPYEEMEAAINSGWISFGVPGTEAVDATITPKEFFKAAAAKG